MQTCTTTTAADSIDSADDIDFIPVVRKQRSRKSRKNGHGLVMKKERSPAEKLERSMAELRSDVNWLDKCARALFLTLFYLFDFNADIYVLILTLQNVSAIFSHQIGLEIVRDAAGALPGEIQTILCLGLGSPTESTQARFQLCFLLELRDTILPVSPTFFLPRVF